MILHNRTNSFIVDEDFCLMPLHHGKIAVFDRADLDKVMQLSWHVTDGGYVRTSSKAVGKNKRIYLHRYLLDCPADTFVDHIDGDKMNNRRSNLRLATPAQNMYNRFNEHAGISYDKGRKKFLVQKQKNGRREFVGRYDTYDQALAAKKLADLCYYGRYAHEIKKEE
jgi:hypothetical protein